MARASARRFKEPGRGSEESGDPVEPRHRGPASTRSDDSPSERSARGASRVAGGNIRASPIRPPPHPGALPRTKGTARRISHDCDITSRRSDQQQSRKARFGTGERCGVQPCRSLRERGRSRSEIRRRWCRVRGGSATGSWTERANRLAHHLEGAGVDPGDTVGLQLANGTEYIEGMLACFKIRAVPINVNYRYRPGEFGVPVQVMPRSVGLIFMTASPRRCKGARAVLHRRPGSCWRSRDGGGGRPTSR